MPFIPSDKECEDMIPSICGNKMVPMMDYTMECIECMPRPYGKCLDELLIPDICDTRCEQEEDLVGAYTTLYKDGYFIINESETQRKANRQTHGSIVAEMPPLTEDFPYDFGQSPPWVIYSYDIYSVVIGTPIQPIDTSWWFDQFEVCKSYDFSNMDTSRTTNMEQMFASNMDIQYLDLSSFDTSNVTSMEWMFSNCSSLKTIVVGDGWNVDNVNPANNDMFMSCLSIVGSNGTTYIDPGSEHGTDGVGAKMAHCDVPNDPGYLTCTGSPRCAEVGIATVGTDTTC